METWQDIKDFFWPAVQDSETSQIFFNSTQALAWANGALWEMGQHAQYTDLIQEQNTANGQRVYTIGSSGSAPYGVWRVEIDGEAIRATTEADVTNLDQNWETRSQIPRFYYLDGFIGGTGDLAKIALYPEPNGIYELRTYCYGVPEQVSDSADTDKLQVPQWAIYGVLWYMLAEAFMAETRRQNLETSAYYRGLYDKLLDRLQMRTASRLPKDWVFGEGGQEFTRNFWSNLPDTIPEP
ncbi:MAG TPA: hypothetical protein VMW24_11060 [Sedimentisphaerales bacterium]|nr:hypothetical protein [Sedimentisphaerales bacterium]